MTIASHNNRKNNYYSQFVRWTHFKGQIGQKDSTERFSRLAVLHVICEEACLASTKLPYTDKNGFKLHAWCGIA